MELNYNIFLLVRSKTSSNGLIGCCKVWCILSNHLFDSYNIKIKESDIVCLMEFCMEWDISMNSYQTFKGFLRFYWHVISNVKENVLIYINQRWKQYSTTEKDSHFVNEWQVKKKLVCKIDTAYMAFVWMSHEKKNLYKIVFLKDFRM